MAAGSFFHHDLKTELKSLELHSDAFLSCNINIFLLPELFPLSPLTPTAGTLILFPAAFHLHFQRRGFEELPYRLSKLSPWSSEREGERLV